MHHIDFASFWPGYDVSIYSRCATQITFALEPSANHLPLCGKCHQPCPLVHDRRTRLVRDRDLFELRVRLQVSIRRVDCLHCGCQILRYLVPGKGYLIRHSAPDLGINLPIALTQYLQNDLLV
ncbi:transposase family protein, partial [Aeromonas sp. QDB18]|uniref:transposase family protein n=1 Tax=Aeromonas sp. QDB18 TaxID=2990486 RepID=UPI003FA4BA5D